MNVETKEFWEMTKLEYDVSQVYICSSSAHFLACWVVPEQRDIIVQLANTFITDNKIENVRCGNVFLFRCRTALNEGKELRKQFINYCIKKYTT